MRNLKFRGKSVMTGEWVYGSLVTNGDTAFIVESYGEEATMGAGLSMNDLVWHKVDSETVGQYIDVYYEGQDLAEKDIVKFKHKDSIDWDVSVVVYFGELGEIGTYPVFDLDGGYIKHHHFDSHVISYLWDSLEFDIELIGNAIDNPELLEENV